MVKEYKDWLFVTVKPGWTDFKIYSGNQLQYLIHRMADMGANCYTIMLNSGSWQIIGKGSSLNENQWNDIVDDYWKPGDFVGWTKKDYMNPNVNTFDTAIESGHSMLRSFGMEPGTTLVLKKNEK